MKGDFSRNTYNPLQHYTRVHQQQGRVTIDADWNEQQAIHEFQRNIRSMDVVGFNGSPKYQNNGFAITRSGGNWLISAGHFYVDGILCINELDCRVNQQPFPYRNIPSFNTLNQALVYIEAWHHHVTTIDDDMIREKALGGADTGSRSQVVWQVHAVELAAAPNPEAIIDALRNQQPLGIPEWDNIITPPGGTLAARTNPAGVTSTPCELPPDAGFLGLENQLYRVEIHNGGNNPSFKWSRNNAAFEVAVETMLSTTEIQLSNVGLDDILRFKNGDWIEFIGLPDELSDGHGQLREVNNVDPDARTITLATPLTNLIADNNIDAGRYRVRLWGQTGGGSTQSGIDITAGWMTLENGLQVHFSDPATTSFRSGDYWLIPARTVTGDIEWPPYNADAGGFAPPQGISRHFAPLAVVSAGNSDDLRLIFPPLNHLQAEDVHYNNQVCDLGADNVQQAIEALCTRGRGHCTIFARNVSELNSALNQAQNIINLHICLAEGDYIFDTPITISNKKHVRITGAGRETLITASRSESALVIRNCERVEIFDLRARGQKGTDANKKSRAGAITITKSNDILIERVDAQCKWNQLREQSCLSVYGEYQSTNVVIRDCHLSVGQGQIGIQVTEPRRVVIENNQIEAVASSKSAIPERFLRDKELIKQIVAGAIGLPGGTSDRSLIMRSIRSAVDVSSRVGGASIKIVAHPYLEKPIINYLESRRNNLSIGQGLELFVHLRKALVRAIKGNGTFSIGGLRVREFKPFIKDFTGTTLPYCEEGIVVAGARIGEVQIRGNEINGAIVGVRVAASDRNDSFPPNWRRSRPPNTIDRAIVENNKILNNPIAATMTSNGIQIGHFNSLIIRGNDIKFLSGLSNEDMTYWMGIRVYGWRGALMRILENTIESCRIGVSVRPNTKPMSGNHWDLVHNGYQDVTEPVDAGGSINTGPHA